MVGYILHFGLLSLGIFVSEKKYETINNYVFKFIIHLRIADIIMAFSRLQIL